jgi:hypothetical protein
VDQHRAEVAVGYAQEDEAVISHRINLQAARSLIF